MPYKINNSANGYPLGTNSSFYDFNKNSNISDLTKKFRSQPLSRYPQLNIGANPQPNNFAQTTQPKVANTFGEGMNVWGRNFLNNMKYIGSSIGKETSGDNYIQDALNSLQNSFGGNLLGQSNDVLRSKIKELEDGAYQVPFPSMNPTHSISLQQPISIEDIVKTDLLNNILAKRDSGYTDEQIEDWLGNVYDNGTEASERHRRVLEEAANIPQTEGWGTVGNIAGGLLGTIPAIVGSAINPALGAAIGGATLGGSLAQNIAAANKEIDMYENDANVNVPSWARRGYAAGTAATDLALDALMQSQYLKHLNLPITGQLRKNLFNKLLNNTQKMHRYNDLFRHSVKQSLPGIMQNAGRLAAEQAGASGLSSASRDLMSYAYKNPEDYPELNDILNNALAEAMAGAGTGLLSGGVASGLGTLIKPHRSKRAFQPYHINMPEEKPLFDLDGLSLKGYMDRENKIKQIIKENYKSNRPKTEGTPLYSINLPNNPLFELGEGMSLMEYNKLVPQLRSALREYYLPKPPKKSDDSQVLYELDFPKEKPIIDLEGLSLKEWTDRENKIRSILGENYKPAYLESLNKKPVNFNSYFRNMLLAQEIMKNQNNLPAVQYHNSLKRIEAEDLSKNMNIRSRIFDNISSLPDDYKKYLDDYSNSKGFFNPETGEVVVIADNIDSNADLHNLFVQKGYSSRGLAGVLGSELDNLLDDIYSNMSNKESAKYSGKGKSSKEVALSYISDLAKNPEMNPVEWNRLSSYVRSLFRNKFNLKYLTDETIQNILWRTGNQITGDDTLDEMIRKSSGQPF